MIMNFVWPITAIYFGQSSGSWRPPYRPLFNTIDSACFVKLPFLDKFFHALQVRSRVVRESLIVAGLAPTEFDRVFWCMLLFHAAIKACWSSRSAQHR